MPLLGWVIALSTGRPDRLSFPLTTSSAYVAFSVKGEAICPARRLRYLHPADLDFLEEGFLPTLSRRDQHHIAAVARRADTTCSGGGASCAAQNTLAAIAAGG